MKVDKDCVMLKIICLKPLAYCIECPKGTTKRCAAEALKKIAYDIISEGDDDEMDQR